MTALRFIGALFALASLIALVADFTPRVSADGRRPGLTSIAMHWNAVAPQSLATAKKAVQTHLHPWVWDPLITSLVSIPAWISLGAIAAALFYAGRRRRRVEIFVN